MSSNEERVKVKEGWLVGAGVEEATDAGAVVFVGCTEGVNCSVGKSASVPTFAASLPMEEHAGKSTCSVNKQATSRLAARMLPLIWLLETI